MLTPLEMTKSKCVLFYEWVLLCAVLVQSSLGCNVVLWFLFPGDYPHTVYVEGSGHEYVVVLILQFGEVVKECCAVFGWSVNIFKYCSEVGHQLMGHTFK